MSHLDSSNNFKSIADQLRLSLAQVEAVAQNLAIASSLAYAYQYPVGEVGDLSFAQWYKLKVHLQAKNQLERFAAHDQYVVEHFTLSPRLKVFPIESLIKALNQVLENPNQDPKMVIKTTLELQDDVLAEALMQEFYLVWFWQLLQQADFLSHQRQFWLQHATVELAIPVKAQTILSELQAKWPSPAPLFKKLPLALVTRFFEFKKNHAIQLQFKCETVVDLDWANQGRLSDAWLQTMANQMVHEILAKMFQRDLTSLLYEQVVEGTLPVLELKLKSYLFQGTGSKPLLWIYPHGRSGVMLLTVDGQGEILDETMIYPYAPDYDVEQTLSHLAKMVIKYHVQAVGLMVKSETIKLLLKTLNLLQSRYPDFDLDIRLIDGDWTKVFQTTQQKHPQIEDVLKMAHFVQHPQAFWRNIDISKRLPSRFNGLPKSILNEVWRELANIALYQHGVDVNQASIQELQALPHLLQEQIEQLIALRPFESSPEIQERLGFTLEQCAGLKVFGAAEPKEEMPKILSLESMGDLETIPMGTLFQGTVTNVMDYGVFIELAKGVEGLLHISALGDVFAGDLASLFHSGELLTVEWNGYDAVKKRLSLKYPYARLKPVITQKTLAKKPKFAEKPQKKQVKPKLEKINVVSKSTEPNVMQLAFAKLKGADLSSSNK